MIRTLTPVAIVSLALTTGCVSKRVHAELEAENQVLMEELAQARSAQVDLVQDVWRLQLTVEELEQELQDDSLDPEVRQRYLALVRDLTPMMNKGEIAAYHRDGQLTLVLTESVYFESGSAQLSTNGLNTVARLAQIMRKHPHWEYEVRGHTDRRPIENETYSSNWDLGAERAVHVVEQLVEHGEFPEDQLSATSFADTQPIAAGNTSDSRAMNRRVEIAVIPITEATADSD